MYFGGHGKTIPEGFDMFVVLGICGWSIIRLTGDSLGAGVQISTQEVVMEVILTWVKIFKFSAVILFVLIIISNALSLLYGGPLHRMFHRFKNSEFKPIAYMPISVAMIGSILLILQEASLRYFAIGGILVISMGLNCAYRASASMRRIRHFTAFCLERGIALPCVTFGAVIALDLLNSNLKDVGPTSLVAAALAYGSAACGCRYLSSKGAGGWS